MGDRGSRDGAPTPPEFAGGNRRPRRKYQRRLAEREGGAAVIPELDAALAREIAKILTAGLSPSRTIRYLVPEAKPEVVAELEGRWLGDPLVFAAVNELNQGAWPDLPKDRRLSIALDKHQSECAWFLYTHRLEDADNPLMAKIEYSRDVLEKATKGEIDPTDPLAAFSRMAREVMEKAVTADRPQAPQLTTDEEEIVN